MNINEFYDFAKAWLSRDPDDPGANDPNETVNWDSRCNIVSTGASQYYIDIDDFILFTYDWLWVACWKQGEVEQMMMSMAQSAPETSLQTESLSADSAANKSTIQPTPQKSIERQIVDLEETAQFLEKLWLEDEYLQKEIDAEDWKEFMEKIYKGLNELQNVKTKTLDMQEVLQ